LKEECGVEKEPRVEKGELLTGKKRGMEPEKSMLRGQNGRLPRYRSGSMAWKGGKLQ